MSTDEKERFAIFCVAVGTLTGVLLLMVGVRHIEQRIDQIQVPPRATPSVASRDFARPPWPSSNGPHPADDAIPADTPSGALLSAPVGTLSRSATATDSTSAGNATLATPSRPADNAEGLGASSGEAGAPGPTVIADRHGTIKQRIAWCESRGQIDAINPVSGASGAWQFLDTTFEAVTGLPGKAIDYPLSVQSEAFDELYAQQGTRPWNASRSCWER